MHVFTLSGMKYFFPLKILLFQVDKNADIYEVCLRVFKQNGASIDIQPGYCLKCGSYCDLESSRAAVSKALTCIKRYALFNLAPSNLVMKYSFSFTLNIITANFEYFPI